MSATETSLRDGIENLYYRYARGYDEDDFAAFGECFTEDAEVYNQDWVRGRETIVDTMAAARRARGELGQLPRHITSNITIEPTGSDEAAVHSLFSLAVTTREGSFIDVVGTYTDIVRRVDGAWRIARRVIARDTWD
jgi:3-phenylpropionate/cinnamic acid dioxygenase small subunit